MNKDWKANTINNIPAMQVVLFSSNLFARNAPANTARITHIAIPYNFNANLLRLLLQLLPTHCVWR